MTHDPSVQCPGKCSGLGAEGVVPPAAAGELSDDPDQCDLPWQQPRTSGDPSDAVAHPALVLQAMLAWLWWAQQPTTACQSSAAADTIATNPRNISPIPPKVVCWAIAEPQQFNSIGRGSIGPLRAFPKESILPITLSGDCLVAILSSRTV